MKDEITNNSELAVVINGEQVLQYDRSQPLPDHQRDYLDKMDRDMDLGIQMDGTTVPDPDPLQRAQFIASHLIWALKQDREPHAAAACSYLAVRIPSLKQVRAADSPGGGSRIELVFDEGYQMSVAVSLDSLKASLKTKH